MKTKNDSKLEKKPKEKMLTFRLSEQHCLAIGQLLAQQPYNFAEPILRQMKKQLRPQLPKKDRYR